MNSKGYLDLSFSWIFAILIGGMILFGAVYGIVKFGEIANKKEGAELGAKLSNLLSPLETDVSSGKLLFVNFPVESRVENLCENRTNTFGRQGVSVSEYVKGDWTFGNTPTYSSNSYIFSKEIVQGKEIPAFSKPLEIPFKVADLIFLIPEEEVYCFDDAPRDINEELEGLESKNLLTSNCDESSSIKVCFKDSDCEIFVNYEEGYVLKGNTKFNFLGEAMMFGAIFSDIEVYECQVSRILYRARTLSSIYREKSNELEKVGCSSPLTQELANYEGTIDQIKSSKDLHSLENSVYSLNRGNRYSTCRLW
jgi:hypothetical protein